MLCFHHLPVLAQEAPSQAEVLYITRYQLASDRSLVYGLFDLGSKPSVRIILPTLNTGKLRFQLHGRHYLAPVEKHFSVSVGFEDVSGRVFAQSPKFPFSLTTQRPSPVWFADLEGVAGLYGNQPIEVQVPPGTTVINLLADDETMAVSPNQLLGYISHIQMP